MSAVAVNSQGQSARQSTRQTRTNPSRTSKTLGRSSFAYGHGSMADIQSATPVAHGFYPALTHFTDAITALPREFRRHNSLLKEVDAKAWALEDNLLQLLRSASESQPVPYPSTPIPESQESKDRRILFHRVRHTLTDLMMTADEKNHVISNANDELDRQLTRLDSIFPFIAGEISDEARLGSLTHWAYTNRNAPKTTTNERPRREAASTKELAHAIHEAEAASRSEARREAVIARRQRRTHADSDLDDVRAGGARKGQSSKSRGGAGTGDQAGHGQGNTGSGQAKRRKVERPAPVEAGAAMERTASSASTSRQAASKDPAEATKKRRAPNTNAAARKRNNTNASAVDSPVLAPSPVVAAAAIPRSAVSPGPGAVRPQTSRAQQTSGQANNGRQRPSSSASNRVTSNGKAAEPKTTIKETTSKTEATPTSNPDTQRETEEPTTDASKLPPPISTKREDTDGKPAPSIEPGEVPAPPVSNPPPKGRSSKTSTPVLPTFSEPTQRVRPTRSTDPAPAKRSHKKNSSVPVVQARAVSEEEESLHEGDDEDEDGEPRYCYCNEISFGEMVACDNDACPREWFHLSCVGLTKPPGKNVKWYCNDMKIKLPRIAEIEASTDILSDPCRSIKVVRVKERFAVKSGFSIAPLEAENIRFVAANSKVRVPKVYDDFLDPETQKRYIIMEYIPGTDLEKLAPSLSKDQKLKISKRIKEALDELRRIPSQGYLGNLNRTPYYEGILSTLDRDPSISGPFDNEQGFNQGILKCLGQRESRHYVRLLHQAIQRTLKGHRIVFTHADLQPKNVMVEEQKGPTMSISVFHDVSHLLQDQMIPFSEAKF
ncbi:putative PHD finger domain protein (Ing1) [Aspergillus neoniger CBS 115656]|uniref:PHD finger domain protein n=1 Tax=Aspergillus neoniger (strain CBS 115656) TaxID=1448310 RepID=A0A318Y555_ASPNB|nr:PHD finger domain protein [Aspergillus neoniger CBS 115656]PYH28587.1 PHD finger domain protein [Aspergillus neoniger CBS 115656]